MAGVTLGRGSAQPGEDSVLCDHAMRTPGFRMHVSFSSPMKNPFALTGMDGSNAWRA
jgi:hypothetical protein